MCDLIIGIHVEGLVANDWYVFIYVQIVEFNIW